MPPELTPQDQIDVITAEEEFELREAEAIAKASGAPAPAPAPAPTPAPVARNYEAEAAHKGWKPKDQFTGDTSQWVDAKTFIERGERFASRQQQKIEALEREMQQMKSTREAFAKFQREQLAAKDRELQEAQRQLRIQHSEAVQLGEHDSAIALEDRIDSLKTERAALKEELKAAEAPAPAPAAAPTPSADDQALLNAWMADGNDWFKTDAKLRAYAVALGDELLSEGETLRGRPFLDKVTQLVQAEFPQRFSNRNRERAPTSEPASRASAASGARTLTARDLPAEDRALMKQFVAEGYYKSEADFLAEYAKNH